MNQTLQDMSQLRADMQAARTLLGRPGKWTQKTYARAVDGEPANPLAGAATCWCLDGALLHVTKADYYRVIAVWNWLGQSCGVDNLVCWNDAPGRSQGEVLALLDRGIEATREPAVA